MQTNKTEIKRGDFNQTTYSQSHRGIFSEQRCLLDQFGGRWSVRDFGILIFPSITCFYSINNLCSNFSLMNTKYRPCIYWLIQMGYYAVDLSFHFSIMTLCMSFSSINETLGRKYRYYLNNVNIEKVSCHSPLKPLRTTWELHEQLLGFT